MAKNPYGAKTLSKKRGKSFIAGTSPSGIRKQEAADRKAMRAIAKTMTKRQQRDSGMIAANRGKRSQNRNYR